MSRGTSSNRDFHFLSFFLVATIALAIFVPNSSILIQKEKSVAAGIQEDLQNMESAVSSSLLDRQYFKDLIDVINGKAEVTNAVIDKMTAFAELPYTIYVYESDSLIYWSKPGLIIDPDFLGNEPTPIIARDHRGEYLIKSYTIYHDFKTYVAYAKIPLLNESSDRAFLRVITEPNVVKSSPEWQKITTLEGVTVCAIHFPKEELGFAQQLSLLFLIVLAGILFTIWLPQLVRRISPTFAKNSGTFIPILTLLALRGASFLFDYHHAFSELNLFEPVSSGSGFRYSLGDLSIDSMIFLALSILASRAPKSRISQDMSRIERGMTSIGSYLIMILSIGVFAWVQRWLVLSAGMPLDLEQISFTSFSNAAVVLALGNIIFGLFIFGERVLGDIRLVQPSIYRRMLDIVLAGLLSVAFITRLDLNVAMFGFYLAVLSLLVLYDLYIDSNNRSVIWAITWTLLISGFEAGLLHAYQSDRNANERLARATALATSLDSIEDDRTIEETILNILPQLPSRYSLGVFKDAKLTYSYSYTYPLLLNDPPGTDTRYDIGDKERSDVGFSGEHYTVLIGKRNTGLMQLVSLFSYVFALFNILLFIITLANSFLQFLPLSLQLSFSSRPTLRTRIQVAIVFLIILSFVIIGFVTVFYLRNTSQDRDKKYFEDRVRAISTSINQAVIATDTVPDAASIVPKIAGIAYVYNRQAKIYNNRGDLILQSDVSGVDRRAPIKMSFVQKFQIDQSSRSYSVFDVRKGLKPGYEGLLALNDNSNNRYGYIELPGTSMVHGTADSGMKFFGTLLNAYVFLFLIAVALAIGVANSITRPLAQLSERLKRINLGRKNEPIEWGIDDEIGALINDYNSMIQKLDESAQLLALTERDTAWREMAKQVAHEIKNPLTPMKLSIQYLQRGVDSNPGNISDLVKRVSNTLIEQIDNLSTIASEFSNFAKMPQAENEKVLLNDVVASVHDLFRKREDMDIQLYVPIQDIYVFADRNQLIRVLNNLVKNAIQAIPDDKRGMVHISLKKQDDNAIIIVEDNGTGIPEHMRDKVFRPNFTTKSSGTGLGLAISANIVQTFNGRIYFETESGTGTRFYIEIPLMKLDDNLKELKRVTL